MYEEGPYRTYVYSNRTQGQAITASSSVVSHLFVLSLAATGWLVMWESDFT
jgi:hypothetical protein